MASWANLITIGTQPGPGILDAIRMVQAETNTSISALIVAEMSSKGLHTRPLIVSTLASTFLYFPRIVGIK